MKSTRKDQARGVGEPGDFSWVESHNRRHETEYASCYGNSTPIHAMRLVSDGTTRHHRSDADAPARVANPQVFAPEGCGGGISRGWQTTEAPATHFPRTAWATGRLHSRRRRRRAGNPAKTNRELARPRRGGPWDAARGIRPVGRQPTRRRPCIVPAARRTIRVTPDADSPGQ